MPKTMILFNRGLVIFLSVAVFFTAVPFLVSAETIVKGAASVPFDTGWFSDKPDAESLEKALGQAKVEAWKKHTSDFKGAKMKGYQKVKDQVLGNLDDYVIAVKITAWDVNKEQERVTVAYRATINSAALQALLGEASVAGKTASGEGSLFAFVFVARKAVQEKSFDDRKVNVRKTETMNAADEKAVTDGTSSSVSSSQTSASKVTTGSSTVKKASRTDYDVTSPEEVDAAMAEVLSSAGFEVVNYDDVVSECGGPERSQIMNEFVAKADMSRASRKAAIAGARECGVKYFARGVLQQGIRAKTPSGNPKIFVKVHAQVWNITKRLPRKVASVAPEQHAGMGPDEDVAYTNGLILAAEEVATRIVDQLNAKGLN